MINISNIQDIIKLAVQAYEDLDTRNDIESTRILLETIKALSIKELEELKKDPQLPELNKKIIDDLIAIKNCVLAAEKDILNREKTLGYLSRIIQLATLDVARLRKREDWLRKLKRKIIYNGTCLAVVYSVLTGDGLFGIGDRVYFYLEKKQAEDYASSYNLRNIKQIFPYFEQIFPDKKTQKFLLQGIVLEFDPTKINAIFHSVEEGRAEFYVDRRVSLSTLTRKCKLKIVKIFGLKSGHKQYKFLFG